MRRAVIQSAIDMEHKNITATSSIRQCGHSPHKRLGNAAAITLTLMPSGQCQDAQIGTIGIYSTQDFGGNVIKFMQCLKAKLLYGTKHSTNAEKSIR